MAKFHLRGAVWVFCVLLAAALPLAGAVVNEQEPNNEIETANRVQCGDTVACGLIHPDSDLDHFRFWVWQQDSIILNTWSCEGSLTNTFLVLYDTANVVLATDDDNGPNWFSRIRMIAPYSGDYILRVMRHVNYTDSAYNLAIACPVHLPEYYDLCTTPRIIPSLPYYNEGTTMGMTSQCGTAAADVFYRFHNPVQGNLFFSVCADFFDARVQMLGGCCADYMDDADEGCNLGAVMASMNVPIGDYYILVEGTSASQAGNFSLEVTADLPECAAPGPVVLLNAGGFPMLDWPEMEGPGYYVVWYSNSVNGVYDHLGTSFFTYYVDSTGYPGQKRFYTVTSVCPW